MKSNVFKKTLLALVASLTVLSTLSGVASTKIYAMKPATQKITNDSTQEPFVACSYKGYNFVIYYDNLLRSSSDREKEVVNQFVETFKKVTDPYDDKIPKENILNYHCKNNSSFLEFIRYFSSIKEAKDQRKGIEETLLDPTLEKITGNSDIPLVKRSYEGYNFVYYCDISSLDEKGKAMIDQYVEAFKEVTNPYDEEIPKEKEIRRVYISSVFCESVKKFCLKSPEFQREFIINNLDTRLRKFKEKSPRKKESTSVKGKLVSLINKIFK